jgi:hypothetical protein
MHPEMKPQRCPPSPHNDLQSKETGGIFLWRKKCINMSVAAPALHGPDSALKSCGKYERIDIAEHR